VDHVHVKVAKYVFPATPVSDQIEVGTPHAHTDFDGEERYGENGELYEYLHREHRHGSRPDTEFTFASLLDPYDGWVEEFPVERDQLHEHQRPQRDPNESPAMRLSSHPKGFERIATADRVLFLLEGCLKEGAAVTIGEATFSCPSITLWDAEELERFVHEHLVGKQVLVVCDSDWRREHDDAVLSQTTLARDWMRLLDVDAYAVAPPMAPDCPVHGYHTSDKGKHGFDDFAGPCTKGEVDDLEVIQRDRPTDSPSSSPRGDRPRVFAVAGWRASSETPSCWAT
jgi:hypothetical protein